MINIDKLCFTNVIISGHTTWGVEFYMLLGETPPRSTHMGPSKRVGTPGHPSRGAAQLAQYVRGTCVEKTPHHWDGLVGTTYLSVNCLVNSGSIDPLPIYKLWKLDKNGPFADDLPVKNAVFS